jgi:putative spermidine/putrescine transport system substrate-binding protein
MHRHLPHLTRRGLLAEMAGSAAWAAAGSPASADSAPFVINTYGGRWEKFWRAQLLPQLEPMLGRSVTLDIGLGNSWVSTFRAAGKAAPPFDLMMANERYAVILRNEGFFEPLPAAKLTNLPDLYPIARYAGDTAVTGIVSPIGIAYRTDLVKKPPKSWRDLWAPEYNGQIGLYSISNSLAVMLLMLAGQLFGKDQYDLDTGFAKVKELRPFPQVDFSGALAPLLTQGQISLAPIDIAEAVALQRKGVPISVVVPEDGVMMFDQSFNLCGAAHDPEAALKYVDFMLRPDIQLLLAREFFTAPVNRKVKIPDDLHDAILVSGDDIDRIIKFDWAFVAKQRDAMLDRWSKEI